MATCDRGRDGGAILRDAAGERGDEACAGAFEPSIEISQRFLADHDLKGGDDLAGCDQRWCAALDRCDCHGLGFGEIVVADRQEPRDRSRRWRAAQGFSIDLFRPPPAARPFADHAQTAPEALGSELPPQLRAVAATGRPLRVEPGQIKL